MHRLVKLVPYFNALLDFHLAKSQIIAKELGTALVLDNWLRHGDAKCLLNITLLCKLYKNCKILKIYCSLK